MALHEGQTILDVRNLSVNFGSTSVLSEISFSVKQGVNLGIVGQTGSGKTLTVMGSLGLISDNANVKFQTINLYDKDSVSNSMPVQAAVVFQNAALSLNPTKSCGHQVQRVIRKHLKLNKKEAKAKVLSLLSEVRIADPERIYKSFPHQVSGGELQRVMIAMGLSCDPSLLILDEPTSSLDKIVQSKIIRLLTDLRKNRGFTIIMISHDLEMLAQVSDHIMHIDGGKKIDLQPVEEFFSKPSHSKSQELVERCKSFRAGKYADGLSGETILEVRNASFVYEVGKQAFSNIDLKIKAQEILAVIGESGSGKSTLGKCISGLLRPSEGEIWFQERLRVSYVFQDAYNSMDPALSVRDIIKEVTRIHDPSLDEENLLKRVALGPELLERKVDQLSGGQRQRLSLARALATRPQVLICDEVTSGLDVNVQFEIVELLRNGLLGVSIIFISHDISLVKFFSHRVVIMKDGKIVEDGPTPEIFEKSVNDYTTELINSVPKVKFFLNT